MEGSTRGGGGGWGRVLRSRWCSTR
jgi:hypothetical protein